MESNSNRERLFFFDNIRWVMIMLVLLMHLNVTYSGAGYWYYHEPGKTGLEGVLFGMCGSWNQAYLLGLLFFIAGYFVPPSFDKRRTKGFVKERLVRLGIPTLVYMLVIHPLTMFIHYGFDHSIPQNPFLWYLDFITSLTFLSTSGPLWFAIALLFFSMSYALVRSFSPEVEHHPAEEKSIAVTHGKLFGLVGIIFLLSFVTRIFIPAGERLFNTETGNFMQLGFFPSYIVLFIVGIRTYRENLLSKMSYQFGIFWFRAAFLIGVPLWFGVMIGGGIGSDPSRLPLFFGGLHWQSAAYSFWEAFFCVAMSTGLITVFREKFDTRGRLAFFLKDNAFGVYVFHAPIMVAITLALRGITLNPVVKIYGMALIVLPICFATVSLMRKSLVIKTYFS